MSLDLGLLFENTTACIVKGVVHCVRITWAFVDRKHRAEYRDRGNWGTIIYMEATGVKSETYIEWSIALINPLTSRPGCMPGSRYTGVGVQFFVI